MTYKYFVSPGNTPGSNIHFDNRGEAIRFAKGCLGRVFQVCIHETVRQLPPDEMDRYAEE